MFSLFASSQPMDTIYMVDADIDRSSSVISQVFTANNSAFGKPTLLCNIIDDIPDNMHINIVLTTNGGAITHCEKILRKLLQHPAGYTAYIRNECYSAGAIIALGADEIVMNNDSYLGKIDPQRGGIDKTHCVISAQTLDSNVDSRNIYSVTEARYILNHAKDLLMLIYSSKQDNNASELMENVLMEMVYSKLPHYKLFNREECIAIGLNVREPSEDEYIYFDKNIKVKDYVRK